MLKKDLKRKQRKKSSPKKKEIKPPKKQHNDSTLPSISPQRPSTFNSKEEEVNRLSQTAPVRQTQNNMSRTEMSFSAWSPDQE